MILTRLRDEKRISQGGEYMRRRKLQQGEGEDNHKKEMCIDIVEAKWLR